MNSRATGRRTHGLRKRFESEERSRGYLVVTSTNDCLTERGGRDLSGFRRKPDSTGSFLQELVDEGDGHAALSNSGSDPLDGA